MVVFAQRLNANEEHMAQLGDLMASISTSSSASAASASAEGGGGRGAVDAAGDVEMVAPSAAPAEGG
eukprot:11028079-Alexandrium_andersonii.AAC.1